MRSRALVTALDHGNALGLDPVSNWEPLKGTAWQMDLVARDQRQRGSHYRVRPKEWSLDEVVVGMVESRITCKRNLEGGVDKSV